MPVQDFGNAFSTFAAQNYGAKKEDRIRKGIRSAVTVTALFSLLVSALVFLFAAPLMGLFVQQTETEIIAAGVSYLLIGILFLWYGFYRAVEKPSMSLILTVISLGTRVVLAYTLSAVPSVGVTGIWASVPIGWFLADLAGLLYYLRFRKKKNASAP